MVIDSVAGSSVERTAMSAEISAQIGLSNGGQGDDHNLVKALDDGQGVAGRDDLMMFVGVKGSVNRDDPYIVYNVVGSPGCSGREDS